MPPKKVNKEEKRREIALSCYDLVHQGIRKITVAEVARTAGIGKGTVYEYFDNKEDIIFEIINIHIEEYHNAFLESIKSVYSTKEKVLLLLKFVIEEDEETRKHFNGYKDYLSVMLSDENETMKEFNTSCTCFFTRQLHDIIQEGIDNKELIEASLNFVDGILCFERGAALMKMTEKGFDAKSVCQNFVDSLFKLLEVKK